MWKHSMSRSTSYWIWYPGDFELYHAMQQNFSRVERGYGWPAFWKSEGFRNRVAFRRVYDLEAETSFCVYSSAVGHVLVEDRKYPFGQTIHCGPGKVRISVHAGCIETFPSIYVKGDIIYSDNTWMAEDYTNPPIIAGFNERYAEESQKPSVWEYREEVYLPVSVEVCEDGVLFGFETELTAVLEILDSRKDRRLRVYCGESREEALDREHCYYNWTPDARTGRCPRCAVRYAFVAQELPAFEEEKTTPGLCYGDGELSCVGAGHLKEEIKVRAIHQYTDIPVRARFSCSDVLIDRIWSVAEHTFRLCSGIFFIDGIKRDKCIR